LAIVDLHDLDYLYDLYDLYDLYWARDAPRLYHSGELRRCKLSDNLGTLSSPLDLPMPSDYDITDLDEFARQFVAKEIPARLWTHGAHLAVGLWHVDRYGADEALRRLRQGIRSLNERHGKENTESAGYHETITCAQVMLLADFLARADPAVPLLERYAQLMASPIADRNVLLRLYSRDDLMSNHARARWTEPDLAPISAEGLLGTPIAAAESA
jgi:hypothetical protein